MTKRCPLMLYQLLRTITCCWWLQQSFTELGTWPHRQERGRSRKLPPTCPCGEEDQITEHVLQRCNIHQPERIAQWPSETPLHQKSYGGLEDLKKTTNFITAAGLACRRTTRRRRRLWLLYLWFLLDFFYFNSFLTYFIYFSFCLFDSVLFTSFYFIHVSIWMQKALIVLQL